MVVKGIERKSKSDYPKEDRKIFAFLSLIGNENVVGSASLKDIEYADDYDLMEYANCKREGEVYDAVLEVFRQKYRQAEKSKNIYIIELKCGVLAGGIPIRWNKEDIKLGYKIIEDRKITFQSCLQMKSRIKMDVIAYHSSTFHEYSEIYLLSFGYFKTYPEPVNMEVNVRIELLKDLREKVNDGKYFKALKRLLSYFRIDRYDYSPEYRELVRFLNGKIGRLSKVRGDLETISTVIINDFRNPPLSDIYKSLEKITKTHNFNNDITKRMEKLLQDEDRESIRDGIYDLIVQLNEIIEPATEKYVNNSKLLSPYIIIE